jgi:hypothetical protein
MHHFLRVCHAHRHSMDLGHSNEMNYLFKRVEWIQLASATHDKQVMLVKNPFHYAPQPNCRFNSDANTGHGFAIFMASVGALRASRSGAG